MFLKDVECLIYFKVNVLRVKREREKRERERRNMARSPKRRRGIR